MINVAFACLDRTTFCRLGALSYGDRSLVASEVMKKVWIVYHDSSPDNNILGVFDDEAEAYEFQERIAPEYEQGALLSLFPVPWRCTDRATEIRI
ncbi:hypothetical protein ACLD0U_05050 [Microbacterium sp. 2216-1]|uniref:hypothetical protein n=1 Tax=Microbacterium sp. 2216-1 TaxID=3390053 RepID=UPI003975F48F